MANFLAAYGTEGPLGFPMQDADAKALETLLQTLEDKEYRHLVVSKAVSEFLSGERADVSWISTEAIDRDKEVVLASGFKDDHFQNNPIVTLNHNYWAPPVGKSLWRKKIQKGDPRGVKAKTIYPDRPENWPEEDWAPDSVFALIQAGLLGGKSIGFLPLKTHSPTEEEIKKKPEWSGVRRIIDEWMLLEYACCWLPTNQEALVEAVSKSEDLKSHLQVLGITPPTTGGLLPETIPFTSLAEIERAINRSLEKIDVAALVNQIWKEGCAKAKGRI